MSSPKYKVNTELLDLVSNEKKIYTSHIITEFTYIQFYKTTQDTTP
jgi:hypothetical protein